MKFTYRIDGMHCAACVEKIKSALLSNDKEIEVTLNPPRLTIEANQQPSLNNLNTEIAKAGKYSLHPVETEEKTIAGWSVYYPLFLIAAYIAGVATINNFNWFEMNWEGWMSQWMAGFFLVFSAFKLLDIKGFADGYSTYDLLAKRWHSYGYIYPFLELSLGILYLTQWFPGVTEFATIIIMGFSSIGVINSLLKKQAFQCACLGTILKVPLSSITLMEDLLMVVMAALVLLMK